MLFASRAAEWQNCGRSAAAAVQLWVSNTKRLDMTMGTFVLKTMGCAYPCPPVMCLNL